MNEVFTEEQIAWLKENLRISLENQTDWDREDLVVNLLLENEVISTDYILLRRL